MSVYNRRIYLSPPHMGESEQEYVKLAFDTNWIAPLGANVDAFEESLVQYCGVKYVAALSSGTAAIHLALILLGVKAGDEVIASTFTFSATINPIVYLGAKPVLVDSEPGTWNLDPILLERAIKERRALGAGHRVKAIIVVHLYGMPANMDKIMAVANKYDIPVIEDAAEALGSKYRGKQVGTYGKIGILSFNGNKIITTSGGGALISNDKQLTDRARFLATQARDDAPHYQHSQVGYNYRMSNVLAGIGRGQIEIIEERVKKRRYNFFFYKEKLEKFDGIGFLVEPSQLYFSNHWLTAIIVDPLKTGTTREVLQKELEYENIESRPLWKPMHQQPIFANYPAFLNNVSDELFEKGLCIPSGSDLSDNEMKRIIRVITRSIKSVR
jgi:dTDP-4-amino-4,6-dideoxygalactose transaminase